MGSGGVGGNGAAAGGGEGSSGEVLSMLALYMDLGLKCHLRVSVCLVHMVMQAFNPRHL
jgi:hypothetical protein